MRKVIVLFLFVLYALFVTGPLFAEEPISTPSANAIEYELPYPGILPDSPLYFLKATRDRVISFLIRDQIKRISFNQLQADKRVHAALLLSKKEERKVPLVISTFSKGENYLELAMRDAADAKKQKKDVATEIGKMQTAAKKYKEILLSLDTRLSSEKEAYNILMKRINTLIKEADQL